MLEDSIEDRLEKAGGLLSDSEKVDAESKDGDNEDNKVGVPLFTFWCVHFFCLSHSLFILYRKDLPMEESKVHQSKNRKKTKLGLLVGKLHVLRPATRLLHPESNQSLVCP